MVSLLPFAEFAYNNADYVALRPWVVLLSLQIISLILVRIIARHYLWASHRSLLHLLYLNYLNPQWVLFMTTYDKLTLIFARSVALSIALSRTVTNTTNVPFLITSVAHYVLIISNSRGEVFCAWCFQFCL
jgi:hypothetical protein